MNSSFNIEAARVALQGEDNDISASGSLEGASEHFGQTGSASAAPTGSHSTLPSFTGGCDWAAVHQVVSDTLPDVVLETAGLILNSLEDQLAIDNLSANEDHPKNSRRRTQDSDSLTASKKAKTVHAPSYHEAAVVRQTLQLGHRG